MYTVEQVFKDTHGTKYDDGTHKVFYNASAWQKCEDTEMRAFLKLIMGMKASTNYTRQIVHEMRTSLKREDVRRNVMRLQEIIDQRVEEKKTMWLAQGDTQGFNRGSRDTKLQTARRALGRGFASDVVADLTGLTLDEVQSLL